MLQWPRVRQQPHNRCPFVLLLNADLTYLPLSSAYSIEVDLPTNGEELNLDTPATSLVDVTIPQDTIPGSEFLVQIGCSEFCVFAPEDSCAGDVITIEVPAGVPFQEGMDENQPPPNLQEFEPFVQTMKNSR